MFKSNLGAAFKNALAETIFVQKYKHEGCETWEELAYTLVEDVCNGRLSTGDKAQLVQYIRDMKFVPGGRYLYYAGRKRKFFNNCLSGDTKFLTHEGIVTLKSKVEQFVSILSPVSNQWEIAKVEYFGKQRLNKITFSNTYVVRATENHRWPLIDGTITETLKIGDIIPTLSKTTQVRVVSIEPELEEDVYCVVEPKHHQFYLENGIATGNCFILISQEDTREDWAELSWKVERCLTVGGGLGNDYSVYRGKNSFLHSTGGQASGPISKMRMINEIGREVMQGGSRRSALYASLNNKHSDVFDFIHAKDWYNIPVSGTDKTLGQLREYDFNFPCPLDMTNISVNYHTDWLMNYWNTGEVGKVFYENCYQAMKTGEPGFSFNFFDKEKETGRNAPVVGSTWIMTSHGYKQVHDIVDTPTVIWTGKQWATTIFKKTRKNDPIVTVTLTGRREITCSKDHPILLSWDERVNAVDLKIGQEVLVSNGITLGGKAVGDAYLLAFVYGDGTFHSRFPKAEVTLCGEKEKLIPYLSTLPCTISKDKRDYLRVYYRNNDIFRARNKNTFPEEVFGWDYESRLAFLAGLLDADGNDFDGKARLGCSSITFLQGVQLLCDSLGFTSAINRGSASGYTGNPSWMLIIRGYISKIPCHRLNLKDMEHYTYKVVSVEDAGYEDVYCCDVGVSEHSFQAGGIIVSNCTEVTSSDSDDLCNLGSLNLGRITSINELKDVTELATKFLLCGTLVADLPYERIYKIREKNRRLGLGLMGLHEWLVKHGERYEVTEDLHRWLAVYRSVSRSVSNSFADHIMVSRPIACRAVAPTGSLGILASTTTGIEPIYAIAFKRRYLKGTSWRFQYVVDATAADFVREYSINPEQLESSVDLAKDFERRIKFQADVQDYVDMGISSTINLPSWNTELNHEGLVNDFAHTIAKYSHRLRGFTVYPDGARGGQPLVSVPYSEAVDKLGIEVEENTQYLDVCTITERGGSCGT